MNKKLLKSMLVVAMAIMGGQSLWADNVITATLEHTAGTRYGEKATAAGKNTVDSETEHYNNENAKSNADWAGYAFAEFSFTIPDGENVTSASLTWTSNAGAKERDNKLYYLTVGKTLDYEKILSEQSNYCFNGAKTLITNEKFSGVATKTTDVTDAVKTIVNGKQAYIIFQWTANAGGGDLYGKASSQAPTLTITTASASAMTTYTVKYVDANGVELKDASTYDVVIGGNAAAQDEDLASFYNADKTKKYIYDLGNNAITASKNAEENIITLKFREAATYNYTVNAVDSKGNVLQKITEGTAFEADNATIAYPCYYNNDGILLQADKINDSKRQYNYTFAVNEENTIKTITYNPTSINNVVYYSEAENIDGLTVLNTGNTSIRSSNSASAYAKDGDVVFTTLPAGSYKLSTVICDFKSSTPSATFSFKAGDETIFTLKAQNINWSSGTSDIFTLTEQTDISLAQGGNSQQGVDLIYIQKIPTTAKVTSAEYATFVTTECNMVAPSSVKAYTVKVNTEKSGIELSEIEAGTVIPAGTALLLNAAKGSYDFAVSSDAAADITGNDLVAATTDVTADGNQYALTKKNGIVGFAPVKTGVTIPAGKAYLQVDNADAAAKFLTIGGEATGINTIGTANKTNDAYYTLQGVKTMKPAKGIYILNGKKVVVNK